ncbi:MAG: right-handed parallel beta-helix repeat-containing protein, partial [Methanobrevibacter sp.]|uniref:right-handed parallel beta-helix repeat-containing protein n=1 Tax=Methanobrevibacter sp. TaxID=66852 RepID=UPI002E788BD6
MKLKKISIILIIFIAFMSIATASAMDDSSSVSLDDSSNYNASDLDLNSADAGSNLLSNQDSISSADYVDSASTSLGELESSDLDSESGVISSHNEESGNSNSVGSDSNILSSSGSDVLSSSGSNVLSASEFVIYEKDYNTYFGSDGKAKASINKAGNIIKLAGTFKNKIFIFTVPLTVTSYNSNTRLYDCIVSFAGGSGTSSNYAKVYGLNIYSNASNAFQRPCIYINEFDYVSVYDNTVFNTGQSSYGIYVYYSNHCNVTRNKVQTRVGIGGCWQHAGICLTGSHYNYIANNDVKVEDSNAIYLSSYNGAASHNNTIFNNTVRCTLSNETPSKKNLTQPSAWCYLIHTMGDNNTIMNNT